MSGQRAEKEYGVGVLKRQEEVGPKTTGKDQRVSGG